MSIDFRYDQENNTLEIEGIKYSESFFIGMSERGFDIGVPLMILSRDNGVITMLRLKDIDDAITTAISFRSK